MAVLVGFLTLFLILFIIIVFIMIFYIKHIIDKWEEAEKLLDTYEETIKNYEDFLEEMHLFKDHLETVDNMQAFSKDPVIVNLKLHIKSVIDKIEEFYQGGENINDEEEEEE